jgi:MoxR-like ATPase
VRQLIQATVSTLSECVLGQEQATEALLAAYIAGGHALLEGVPGLGKTLLARCFAACLGVPFARIQFTPDLMPADVIGTNVFDPATGSFQLLRGPVFTHILMADEINRTPPKTQSALLEAMQERQVTIDGESYPLPAEFFVIATQNPLEHEGVYPLPEAQLDRFLVRIDLGLPSAEAEVEIYRRAVRGDLVGWGPRDAFPSPVMAPEDAALLRRAARGVHVAPDLLDYLYRLATAVRSSPNVELGISPRGALALLELARAGALLEERDFVAPDDLKRFLVPCWAHRVILTAEFELEGQTPARLLEAVAASVEVPH